MSIKVLQILTDRVVTMLKDGKVPWRKTWKNTSTPHSIEGYPYRGINFFLLSMLGHEVPVYLTLPQISKRGGKLKAGEEKNHSPVFFWTMLDKTQDKQGNPVTDGRKIPFTKYTRVWNISQVEGIELPKRFRQTAAKLPPNDAAQAIVDGYKDGPTVTHGGDRACYSPVLDKIMMPPREAFIGTNEYYCAFFHEMTHSTGHLKRLNRREVMDGNAFGSHAYSAEELVAEMGAAMLCAHAGIDNTLENSAAYIADWLEALKNDPKMLMFAAGKAQKAFAHIVPDVKVEDVEESEEAAA